MNLLFIGPPGAGKGTQAKRFAQNGAVHLATGDILRQEKEKKTSAGQLYEQLCSNGGFAPDRLVAGIVTMHLDALLKSSQPWNGYILDGFPRNLVQASIFNDFTTRDKRLQLEHVVEFKLGDVDAILRMTSRWQCTCSAVYGGLRRLPEDRKCVECKRDLYQRKEDLMESALNRMLKYHQETEPLVAHYKHYNILYTVDARLPPETITDNIHKHIANKTTKVYTNRLRIR
jgi:adenylate kinase